VSRGDIVAIRIGLDSLFQKIPIMLFKYKPVSQEMHLKVPLSSQSWKIVKV
jgi:hypothetical protein